MRYVHQLQGFVLCLGVLTIGNEFLYAQEPRASPSIATDNCNSFYFGTSEPDHLRESYWYRKSAEAGYSGAMFNLASQYMKGLGVPLDNNQALYWYHRAISLQPNLASIGEPIIAKLEHEGYKAALHASPMPQGDFGPPPPQFYAVSHPSNQAGLDEFSIAQSYGDGVTVGKDALQAGHWCRLAADERNPVAMFLLGRMFELGVGVRLDDSQALYWYRQALSAGNSGVQGFIDGLEKQGLRAAIAPLPLDEQSPVPSLSQSVRTQAESPSSQSIALAAARAEAAEDRKAENEEKISELQQDIDGDQESVESFQGDIDQLGECSGIGAAICEAGAAKIRRDQNKLKSEISEKQKEIASLRSESSAATADPSEANSGGSYAGPNSVQVQSLLSQIPGSWSCPSSKTEAPTSKPIIPSSLPCMRDKYVWSAVLQAWAAECHARLGMESEAEENAGQMMQSLNTAKSMCSSRPAVGGSSCSTMSIYSCSE